MIDFKEFVEDTDKKIKEILKILKDILDKDKEIKVKDFLNEDRAFLYIEIDKKDDLYERFKNLDLGIKILSVGNHIVFRLHQGAKGNPIGPAKKLLNQNDLQNEIEKGKSEIKAYKDVFVDGAGKLKTFMTKVLSRLETGLEGKPQFDMDIEKRRELLNSIVNTVFM